MSKNRSLKIFLIRHGKSIRNKLCHLPYLPDDEELFKKIGHIADRDTPLSEEGFLQAKETGIALCRRFCAPDYVFHSGYLRTIQTAEEIISAYKKHQKEKIKILKDDSIRERGVGYVYNMQESEARKLFPWIINYRELFSDFDFCPPGGESLVHVVDRVGNFIETLAKIPLGKTVFIVSHGRAIQCLMYILLGRDFKAVFEHPQGPVKNCGVTLFEMDKKGLFVLKEYNKVFYEKNITRV